MVALHFTKMGHEVTVLCAKTSPLDPSEIRWEGGRILHRKVLPDRLLNKFPYPNYLPLAAANGLLMFYLIALLRKESFNLIREDISPVPPSGLLSLFFLRARRLGVTHNFSETWRGWRNYYGTWYGTFGYVMNLLLRRGYCRYDRIICDGQWFAEELRSYSAIRDIVEYVPNGVDVQLFCRRPNEKSPRMGRRLLCVGRLVETKGHVLAIHSLADLAPRWPDISLTIVGGGPLRQSLLDRADELGVGDRLRILPSVVHEKMPELLASHDYFFMPSYFEGLPVALLEAMASGIPIVASDIPAIRGVVGDGAATLFRVGDVSDMSEKLDGLFRAPKLCSEKCDRAFLKAQEYTWDGVASRELEISGMGAARLD